MFERIANGWDLAKQSYRVLWLDKELLLFPFLSGVACLLVLASFALPLYDSQYATALLDEQYQRTASDPLFWVIAFAFYFCNYFVITFFNSALVGCAVIRFDGGDPTIADGFRIATSRLPQIFAWSLLAATVGTILKAIESRSEAVGRIVAGLLGLVWSIATYFVVPVLVIEKVGPIEAVNRSGAVLKRTWGEAIVANFGLGLISFGLFLLACVPTLIGLMLGEAALIVGIGITVVLVILLSLASSAASAIVLAALYEYAANGKTSEFFDEQRLQRAFVRK